MSRSDNSTSPNNTPTPTPTHPPRPKVLPALLEVVNAGTPSQDLLEKLIYALDAFVENMSSESVLPYVPPLMQLLGAVLSGPSAGAHREALSCLASVVAAAGKSFHPYASELGGAGGGNDGRRTRGVAPI
jgi:hypothetical protein